MMLKVLLKKQFMEMFRSYFVNPKTGTKRSGKQITRMFILFAFLILICSFSFFSMGAALAEPLYESGNGWLFFSIFGILGTLLGVFGSVFNTYASLYKAKDNDLILSLPLKPSTILLSRIVPVYILSLLYSGIVFLPSLVCYCIFGEFKIKIVISALIQTFILTLLISAVTCLLGWIVAMVSGKMKSKKIITALLAFVFFFGYYYLSTQIGTFLQSIADNAEHIAAFMKNKLVFYYFFGKGIYGNIPDFLIVTAVSVVAFGCMIAILSKNYFSITTHTFTQKRKNKNKTVIVKKSVSSALLSKELKKFTSSTTYMLNCGLGLVLLPIASIALLIKREAILLMLNEGFEADISFVLPIAAFSAVCLLASTIDITSPSISLEGKNIWLSQSIPVKTELILKAKVKLQFVLSFMPVVFTAATLCFVFSINLISSVLILAGVLLYSVVSAQIGLLLNLHFPNLAWTNETQPIKSSLPVFISMFGGWALSFAVFGIYFLVASIMAIEIYLIILVIILAVTYFMLNKKICSKGVKMFMEL